MRITFIGPWHGLNGGVRANISLAEHLRKRGHDVLMIAPKIKRPSLRKQLRSLFKGNGWIRFEENSHAPHLEGVGLPCINANHHKLTDEDVRDADIVVATWWETAEWVAELSPTKGAKMYMIRHHEVHDYLPKERSAATYRLPLHKVTISKWLVELMRDEYGDSNVSFVYDCIDPQRFNAPERQKQPIPTVGMMYSTKSWKGCDISLQAFSLAAKQCSELRLVAFGTEDLSPDLPLPKNSTYFKRPPQDMLAELYATCDAWLFGSRLEGFGLPILEAMACRTPVIGTPAGAAPELLGDGSGILGELESPESLAQGINTVVNLTNSEWVDLSNKAFVKSREYSWDNAAALFEKAALWAIERTKKGEIGNITF